VGTSSSSTTIAGVRASIHRSSLGAAVGAWCQGGAGYEEELEIVLCGRCHCDSDPTPPRAGDPRRAMQWQRLLRHVCRPNGSSAFRMAVGDDKVWVPYTFTVSNPKHRIGVVFGFSLLETVQAYL
jgi:hypothetical protein